MAGSIAKKAGRLVCAAVIGGLFWSVGGQPAAAQKAVSEKQIINALTKPVTRSLTSDSATTNDDRRFIESLRGRRSLTADERDQVSAIAKKRPNVDLEIYFDFDSAAVTSKAVPQLDSLGRALTGPELKGSVVLLGGHTDAKGSDDYNQTLSERRAEAVREYLHSKFGIATELLTAVGYGEKELKNKAKPYAAENRRVQIVNLASQTEASAR
jgi:outer membrane protein OmpA-like peptidoglycan-associated protein